MLRHEGIHVYSHCHKERSICSTYLCLYQFLYKRHTSTHTIIRKGANVPHICVCISSCIPHSPERSGRYGGKQPADKYCPADGGVGFHYIELQWVFYEEQSVQRYAQEMVNGCTYKDNFHRGYNLTGYFPCKHEFKFCLLPTKKPDDPNTGVCKSQREHEHVLSLGE